MKVITKDKVTNFLGFCKHQVIPRIIHGVRKYIGTCYALRIRGLSSRKVFFEKSHETCLE